MVDFVSLNNLDGLPISCRKFQKICAGWYCNIQSHRTWRTRFGWGEICHISIVRLVANIKREPSLWQAFFVKMLQASVLPVPTKIHVYIIQFVEFVCVCVFSLRNNTKTYIMNHCMCVCVCVCVYCPFDLFLVVPNPMSSLYMLEHETHHICHQGIIKQDHIVLNNNLLLIMLCSHAAILQLSI